MNRILQVVADGAPGGGTTAVLGLCEDLRRLGRWQTTLVSEQDSYAAQSAAALGLDFRGLNFFRSRLDPSVLRSLLRVIDELRPAVIHAHGGRAALPLAVIARLRPQIRFVYTVHGFHFSKKSWMPRLLGVLAERFIARSVDAVVYVSKGDRALARDCGIESAGSAIRQVIYNGIEPGDLARVAGGSRPYDLIFLGRMVPQKNPMFMVELARLLKPLGLKIAMVGGGELQGQVRQALAEAGVADELDFRGPLDRPAALAVLKSSKIFVFPSLWEGLPITPIEASFLGIPTVASAIPGTDEVVIDGYNGFTIGNFEADRYKAAIVRLLTDSELARQLGDNGRALVQEKFLRSRCSSEYCALYDQLLGLEVDRARLIPARQEAPR